MTERIRIGELAARCGVSRDTIRFYERAGLLPKPRRTATRHRVYDHEAARQLRFIRAAQEFGMTLDDIRQLIGLQEQAAPDSGRRTAGILQSRLDAVRQRLATFEKYRDRLSRVLERLGDSADRDALYQELGIDDDRGIKEA